MVAAGECIALIEQAGEQGAAGMVAGETVCLVATGSKRGEGDTRHLGRVCRLAGGCGRRQSCATCNAPFGLLRSSDQPARRPHE